MKKSCWAQNKDELQVPWERCLKNKFNLLFSDASKEKPLLNHKPTVSKFCITGWPIINLTRRAQRAPFKETFMHLGNRNLFSWNLIFQGWLITLVSSVKMTSQPRRLMNKDSLVLFQQCFQWLSYLFSNRRCQEKPLLLCEYITTNFLFMCTTLPVAYTN